MGNPVTNLVLLYSWLMVHFQMTDNTAHAYFLYAIPALCNRQSNKPFSSPQIHTAVSMMLTIQNRETVVKHFFSNS